MEESFKGKMLVRKSKLPNGNPCLILTGIFYSNLPEEMYDDRDEMWAVQFNVVESKKFVCTQPSGLPYSPEDFLGGCGQDPNSGYWKPKEQ